MPAYDGVAPQLPDDPIMTRRTPTTSLGANSCDPSRAVEHVIAIPSLVGRMSIMQYVRMTSSLVSL